jgi:hypothetical protein
MRNRIVASNASAQIAGTEVLAAGGNATDAVLAAALVGATLSTSSALLGGGVLLTAGLGIGAYSVDGRARAPGVGMARMAAPESPSVRDQIAVPALFEAVLTAHNRFGKLSLSALVQSAVRAVKEYSKDPVFRARLKVVEALPKHGPNTLQALGIHQSIVEACGRAMHGVITRDDLKPQPAPINELLVTALGAQQVLTMMLDAEPRIAPPPPPPTHVGVAIAADLHGAMAAMVWAEPDETVEVSKEYCLFGAKLNNAPTKGVTRRTPGTAVPLPTSAAIIRDERGAWAICGASGLGAVEAKRDAMLVHRLTNVVAPELDLARIFAKSQDVRGKGLSLWLVREQGDDVRAIEEGWETP